MSSHPDDQFLPRLLMIFQDALLELTIGALGRRVVEEDECRFIYGDMDVELRPKHDSNLPLSISSEFIRA